MNKIAEIIKNKRPFFAGCDEPHPATIYYIQKYYEESFPEKEASEYTETYISQLENHNLKEALTSIKPEIKIGSFRVTQPTVKEIIFHSYKIYLDADRSTLYTEGHIEELLR